MSRDSKIFVACSINDALNVGRAAIARLDQYARDLTDSYYKENTNANNRAHFLFAEEFREEAKSFSNGCSVSTYDFETFVLTFGTGEELKRSVHMFTTCDGDYCDTYEGYKVIFSIGYWGKSDEILKVIGEVVKEFGRVFYDFNDCDDEDFVELFV